MLTVISSTVVAAVVVVVVVMKIVGGTEEVATTATVMVMVVVTVTVTVMVGVRGILTVVGYALHAQLIIRLELSPVNAAAESDLPPYLPPYLQTTTAVLVMGKVMIMTGGVLRSVSWTDFEQRRKRRGVILPMPLVARRRGNVG